MLRNILQKEKSQNIWMMCQVFKERGKLENPNEILSPNIAHVSYIILPHKYLYCDGVQAHFAEQAENAALGEPADSSFIQLLCLQAISDILK